LVNEARFRALFDATYPALARYARHRGLHQHDAEDLIASTYEVAWRRLDAVPEGDEALLWLYTVAFHNLRNLRRSERQRAALLTRLPVRDPDPAPAEPTDLEVGAIRRALAELGEDDREVILLVAGQGLTSAQAGAVLGCSAVAARARLYRARRRLARLLRPEPEMSHAGHIGHERVEIGKQLEASG
jgi:RNA polymerase sigma factor (sigma-70 family)